ncbi:MAG: nitrate reductase molybdenum cofactor assembly chaperone [Nocardioidaceae bacterium]
MFRFSRGHVRPIGVESTWAAAAALLDYPTPELLASLGYVEALVRGHAGLAPVIEHLRATPLRDLQEEYVATFDHTRKCALYLTYFAYGDTRRRGVALVQFKQAYRAGGAQWDEAAEELPDHLCAVLQFGATVDADAAWRLLIDHRAGLEMLRLALAGWERSDGRGIGSPWLGAVVAVCDTLPVLQGDEADAVRRLVEQGPPAEEVGLEPYGTDPVIATSIPVGAPQ